MHHLKMYHCICIITTENQTFQLCNVHAIFLVELVFIFNHVLVFMLYVCVLAEHSWAQRQCSGILLLKPLFMWSQKREVSWSGFHFHENMKGKVSWKESGLNLSCMLWMKNYLHNQEKLHNSFSFWATTIKYHDFISFSFLHMLTRNQECWWTNFEKLPQGHHHEFCYVKVMGVFSSTACMM